MTIKLLFNHSNTLTYIMDITYNVTKPLNKSKILTILFKF